MTAPGRTHVAFHATGRRLDAHLEPVAGLDLRPALFARYHDITTLRYDFPLVLLHHDAGGAFVRSLSGLMDERIATLAQEEDAPRITRDLLKVERLIRSLSAKGQRGPLLALWDVAAATLGANADDRLRRSLGRARDALPVEGDIVDCDRELPRRLFEFAWRRNQSEKGARFRARADHLAQQLREMLRGDFVRSEAGRSAGHLRAAFGGREDAFDFDVLSRTLATAAPRMTMSEGQLRRVEALVAALESPRFFSDDGEPGDGFIFESCADALDAYRERLPVLVEFARCLAIAQLVVAGTYDESRHDALFAGFGADDLPLDSGELAAFPDYLVHIDTSDMSSSEPTSLMDALSSELPMKVLLETDFRSAPLAGMAMGITSAYVFQAPSSHLYQLRNQIAAGLSYPGPALFSVFPGAVPGLTTVPPYLVAAAALESRAFPAFTYDPSAGRDWSSRVDLSANPQPEKDWPLHRFDYADRGHQRVSVELAFTYADFVACDPRYARHLALVPSSAFTDDLTSISDWLVQDSTRGLLTVPSVLMVDCRNRLQRVLADETLIRETRLCRDRWHRLQELSRIHSSHAARSIATPRSQETEPDPSTSESSIKSTGPPPPATIESPEPAVAEATQSSGDPYIETPRCSTCNECVQINNRMFAYNENRQAYIADAAAGTYRELVEAAESCQVSIIHPGKPRDPAEPDIDELIARAQAFL